MRERGAGAMAAGEIVLAHMDRVAENRRIDLETFHQSKSQTSSEQVLVILLGDAMRGVWQMLVELDEGVIDNDDIRQRQSRIDVMLALFVADAGIVEKPICVERVEMKVVVPVGATVRVNTVHVVGQQLRVYINGSLVYTVKSKPGSYYDKFGAYRTASGAGPITVVWSNVQFWQK